MPYYARHYPPWISDSRNLVLHEDTENTTNEKYKPSSGLRENSNKKQTCALDQEIL